MSDTVRYVDTAAISVIASSVVGLSGVGTAVWTTARGATVARAERREQRSAEAYIQILELVHRTAAYHTTLLYNVSLDHYEYPTLKRQLPDPLTPNEVARAHALIDAHASADVRQAFRTWDQARLLLLDVNETVRWNSIEGGDPRNPASQADQDLYRQRLEAENVARDSLSASIARDLGSR